MFRSPPLTYRRIDLARDGDFVFESYRAACQASFGSAKACSPQAHYLHWLGKRIEEFPDGNVVASIGENCVGQLELQVPYGLTTGYVNLYYVAPAWRRLGLGRRLHEFAEQYFRSWEATTVELHVSPANTAALSLYRSLGYRYVSSADLEQRTRMMRLLLKVAVS